MCKLLAVLMIALPLLTAAPVSGLLSSGSTGLSLSSFAASAEDIEFNSVNDDTGYAVSGSNYNADGKLEISSTYEDKPVVAIAAWAEYPAYPYISGIPVYLLQVRMRSCSRSKFLTVY